MAGAAATWQKENAPKTPIAPTSIFGNPNTFTAAANTQASDYDKIMKSYRDIASSAGNTGFSPISTINISAQNPSAMSFSPIKSDSIAPQLSRYEQSGDVTNSLGTLNELARTGGYSEQGIQDLRARGIAPTRSIYANAQQNIERQRALQGGYSPNFTAAQAQLARDESNQISDINTNVNAGIAQNVASNRISAAPSYASASATANAAKTSADQRNTDIINRINELNTQNKLLTDQFNTSGAMRTNEFNATGQRQTAESNAARALEVAKANQDARMRASATGNNTALSAAQGQANLYGTTPALTNTFGNQVTQATQLGQNQQQLDQQRQRDIYGAASRFGMS